jgi:MFS family permease
MDSAGAVIGPLIGLLLLGVFNTPLRTILVAAAIPGFLGLFLFLLVKEVKAEKTTVRKLTIWASIKGFSKEFKLFLLGLAIFSLGNSSDTFLILKSKQIGLSVTVVILAYVLYNAFYTLFSTPAGIIADKIGAMKVFLIGLVLYAFVYCGFALNTSEIGVFVLFAVYGFYIAMTDGIAKALVGSFVTQEQAGTAYGLIQTVMGLFTLLASVIGGFIWSLISPSATFYFGALCAALAFVFFFICFRKKAMGPA